jgi:murein biosynthesis integral membrane protein MurJ
MPGNLCVPVSLAPFMKRENRQTLHIISLPGGKHENMSLSQRLQTTGHLMAVQLKAANKYIWRALLSLASAALLLRLGGMVNQVVVSAKFGAGPAMDAYFVAAAFPLLLVQLISSAIEAAVIPVYSQLRMRSSREETARLFSTLLNCMALGALLLTLALFASRQPLVFFSAPGLDEARLNVAVGLTPLLYMIIPLSLVTGLLECVLNAEGQFGWPAYAGLLVPLTTALLALLGGRSWGIVVLCAGSLCGTVLQFVVVCVRASRAGLRYQLVMDVRNPHLRLILHSAWPVLLGALISQGSPLVDQIFASTLPAGSISALNYALKLVSIFSGVIFVSVGRAILPYLARQAALGDPEYRAFKGTLRLYLWGVVLCTLLLSLLLLLLARPLVQLLFQHGAFSEADTRDTVLILSGFGIGLMPMATVFLLSRAFNALGETRIPMYIAFVSVGANALCDALFAHFWQSFGIALATSAVSLLSSLLLLITLRHRLGTLRLWHLPGEIRNLFVRLKQRGRHRPCVDLWHAFTLCSFADNFRQRLLFVAIALPALAVGTLATVREELTALRVVSGMLIALWFLRYPYVLLLAWVSINVGIGSSLAFLNGNNLDLVLILPLLLLLVTLPWKEIVRRMPGLPWLVLYLAWVLAGMSLSPLDTRAFLTLWLTMVAFLAVGVLVIGLITTRRRLLRLIDTLLATALLVALYGLYGYATRQRGEVDPATLLFRITSLFTQATTFAFYLSPVIPLALYRCWTLRGAKRLAGVAVALCLLAALALTFTRSAYMGLFLGMLILALYLPTRGMRLCVIGGLLALSTLAIVLAWSGQLPFLARFFNGDIATLNGRVYLWQALLSRFQLTQWMGNGLQASDQLLAYLRVGGYGQGVIGTAPHNLFLGTLYDHGVIGLLLLCATFLSTGRRLLKGVLRSGGERRLLYAAALAALVSVLLQSFGSRDLWIQAAGLPFWVAIALPFARCWPQSEEMLDKRREDERESPGSSLEILPVPAATGSFD